MKLIFRNRTLSIFLIISSLLSGCSTIREQNSYIAGNNTFNVRVRGNAFANPPELKQSWYIQAEQTCPNGYDVQNLIPSVISHMGWSKPVLEGVIRCNSSKIVQKIYEEKPKKKQKQIKKKSSGSGFFISHLGHLLTNEHVINNCNKITVKNNFVKELNVKVHEVDKRNDLALLKVSLENSKSKEINTIVKKLSVKIIPLASNGLLRAEDVFLGENVLVSGYPFGNLFSNSIKVTKGIVSSNKGMGNNSGQFQIDAAVQPGNSGGPIYDEYGNVIGVVVAQLNKLKFAKHTGSMPENVNFGIKASTIRQFLNSSGLIVKWSNRKNNLTTRKLAEIAKKQTVMVNCN